MLASYAVPQWIDDLSQSSDNTGVNWNNVRTEQCTGSSIMQKANRRRCTMPKKDSCQFSADRPSTCHPSSSPSSSSASFQSHLPIVSPIYQNSARPRSSVLLLHAIEPKPRAQGVHRRPSVTGVCGCVALWTCLCRYGCPDVRACSLSPRLRAPRRVHRPPIHRPLLLLQHRVPRVQQATHRS